MYALAADTGGKALLDVNDLTVGMVNAQKAISSYYILGYYTTNTTLDGKFRKIAITLKDLSAKLDFRSGYYAGKKFNKFTTADKERQFEDALMLGDPITDLTIQMEVNYFQLNKRRVLRARRDEDPRQRTRPGPPRRRGAHADRFHRRDQGRVRHHRPEHPRQGGYQADAAKPPPSSRRSPSSTTPATRCCPGSYTIKVLARDDETGRIGTYMSKFVVPNLNKEDKRVPISSVVLSSQRVDLHDALFTAGKTRIRRRIRWCRKARS